MTAIARGFATGIAVAASLLIMAATAPIIFGMQAWDRAKTRKERESGYSK